MSWKLFVTSSAESDIMDGFVDYEERLSGLGEKFLDEVEDSFNRIESNPYLYQEFEDQLPTHFPISFFIQSIKIRFLY